MKHRRCAFTLVEILVVLGIITLLAALLFTVFSRVREGGRRTVCVSNQKQIYAAFQLYLADNNGVYPKEYDLDHQKEGGWVDSIAALATSPAIFHCPSDSRWPMREIMATNGGRSLPSSYIVNRRVLTKIDIGVKPGHERAFPFRGTIVSPSTTVLLCDGAEYADDQAPYVVSYSGEPTFTFSQWFLGNALEAPYNTQQEAAFRVFGIVSTLFAPSARHNGRSNLLFFDGHVKSMPNAQWYFPNTPYLDPARGG